MLHMNQLHMNGWRTWRQLERIANASSEAMANYTLGVLTGSAIERGGEPDEVSRLLDFANRIADARIEELRNA